MNDQIQDPAGRKSSGSWLAIRAGALALVCVALAALMPPAYDYQAGFSSSEEFVETTLSGWREKYSGDQSLQVARIDIRFSRSPDKFARGEGVIIAPVGIDLPGAQQVLETAAYPHPLRKLSVEGINCLTWEYPGKVNRDMHAVALSLVRQSVQGAGPSLPSDVREDALATAKDLEEHSLDECSAFEGWVSKTAGPPPESEQIQRLAAAVLPHVVESDNESLPDDICASIRKSRFSLHRAHVVMVMAARQLGIPAYAFSGAGARKKYLVGVFLGPQGWQFIDIAGRAPKLYTEQNVLLTKAPLASSFEGSSHDFWFPEASAYQGSDWGGLHGFADTATQEDAAKDDDYNGIIQMQTFSLSSSHDE